MMTLASIILFLIVLASMVLYSANRDAEAIHNGEAINHRVQWVQRAFMGVCLSAASTMVSDLSCFNYYTFCGFLLMSAGGFSALFRCTLNKLRGEWWWYMGAPLGRRKPGASVYDTLFHWLAWNMSGRRTHEGWPDYPSRLSALIANTAEVLAFVAGLTFVIL